MEQQRSGGDSGTWFGFLAMAFVIVGLTGIFATYAAPLPLQRALADDAALDGVLHAADPAKALEALRPILLPILGENAEATLSGPGDLADRVARARGLVRAHFEAEAADYALRIRILVGVVTLAGALFGAAVVSILGRRR